MFYITSPRNSVNQKFVLFKHLILRVINLSETPAGITARDEYIHLFAIVEKAQ